MGIQVLAAGVILERAILYYCFEHMLLLECILDCLLDREYHNVLEFGVPSVFRLLELAILK